MSTELIRLNITLPLAIAKELDQFSEPRKRSQFIAQAIKQRIVQLKKKKMEMDLAEGYQATKNEGIEIAQSFENIDIENWDDY